jgi:hypothetical protein
MPCHPESRAAIGFLANTFQVNRTVLYIEQLSDTLPILEKMGYEVCAFNVQWSLPPSATLRLRSASVTNQAN